MTDYPSFVVPDNYEDIWLIGITIDPDREQPNFYTIIFAGDTDLPLTTDGYIVFFSHLDCLIKAIDLQRPDISKQIDISDLYDFNIAQMLYLLQSEQLDCSNIIVDTLNIILELVKASGFSLPIESKKVLFRVADFFTFNQNIAELFAEDDINRREAINAVLWCIGAIASKSKFL